MRTCAYQGVRNDCFSEFDVLCFLVISVLRFAKFTSVERETFFETLISALKNNDRRLYGVIHI